MLFMCPVFGFPTYCTNHTALNMTRKGVSLCTGNDTERIHRYDEKGILIKHCKWPWENPAQLHWRSLHASFFCINTYRADKWVHFKISPEAAFKWKVSEMLVTQASAVFVQSKEWAAHQGHKWLSGINWTWSYMTEIFHRCGLNGTTLP